MPLTFDDGTTTFTLQASPIVRFVSRPADSLGFHSLVQTAELAFDLPPFATVRLEEILPPRRWMANGKSIQQRGLTVSVTFG